MNSTYFKILAHLLNISVKISEKLAALVLKEMPPEPAPEPVAEMHGPKQIEVEERFEVFVGDNKTDQVPLSLEDLPDPDIFFVMFERKFGTSGVCEINIEGKKKQFSCDALYLLLRDIKNNPEPNTLFKAVYGSVMSIIMHAHGEPVIHEELN